MKKTEKLLSLYNREKDATSGMDGFQIAVSIENLLTEILSEMLKLEPIKNDFSDEPDIMFEVPALGRHKNLVFFEAKSGSLVADFQLLQIEKTIRALASKYSNKVHSIVVVAKSFLNEQRIVKLCDECNINIELLSAETLAFLADFLDKDSEFLDLEIRNIFLSALFNQTGLINVISTLCNYRQIIEMKAKDFDNSFEDLRKSFDYWSNQRSRLQQRDEYLAHLKGLKEEFLWAALIERNKQISQLIEYITDLQKMKSNFLKLSTEIKKEALELNKEKSDELRSTLEQANKQILNLDNLGAKLRCEIEDIELNKSELIQQTSKTGPEMKSTRPLIELEKEITLILNCLEELKDIPEDTERKYLTTKKELCDIEEQTSKFAIRKQLFSQIQLKLSEQIKVLSESVD
jgi:hypothetical protein